MSAQPTTPATAPDQVGIEIDGKAMAVPKGSMIIHAADKAGIAIPRFCYHDKLPIAANCRMCLVDVEKSPKPVPACATPVMEGMKIYTQSRRSLDAQRNVMEFLLVNHPLDCPICDQGGECELQDVALGYGRSVSRYVERKRVVADEDLGPLVATDMTRCIHCTRCVRFMGEIAGTYELGGMGRGEDLAIGTYVGQTLQSELSGNVIDVCPVGALTNKVFRFRARPWELTARESVGYHDALGSNLFLHVRRGEVLRTVPRDNEAVNECWLSDRDRYSHQGLRADDRVSNPEVRGADGTLRAVPWDEAIRYVADGLKQAVLQHGAEQLGVLLSPATSSEEGLLLTQVANSLGCLNVDHRLRLLDAGDTAAGPVFELPLAQVAQANAILLLGCNPRLEAPLLGHRVHMAAKRGARVYSVDTLAHEFQYALAGRAIATPSKLVGELLALARAAGEMAPPHASAELAAVIAASPLREDARATIAALHGAASKVVIAGEALVGHPGSALLRVLARYVARACGCHYDELAQGANAIGLRAVGALPHGSGLSAPAMLAAPRSALVLYGAELPHDFADPAAARAALAAARFVVAFTPYADTALRERAHAILPIGLLPEIDGTVVNVDGTAQSVTPGAALPGEARPGWRVLRALGAALGLPGFDFTELSELRLRLAAQQPGDRPAAHVSYRAPTNAGGLERIAPVPTYRIDAVTRRAAALQAHPLTGPAEAVLHPEDALARGLATGAFANVADGQASCRLPVRTSTAVPRGAVRIDATLDATLALAPGGAVLTIERADA